MFTLFCALLSIYFFLHKFIRDYRFNIALTLAFIIIFGLRSEVGGDWESYSLMYQELKSVDKILIHREPLFHILCQMSPSFRNLIFVTSTLTLIFFSYGMYLANLSNFLLFYILSFLFIPVLLICGYIRQGLAASLFFLAFVMMRKRMWLLMVISIIVALSVHNPLGKSLEFLAIYLGDVTPGVSAYGGVVSTGVAYSSKGFLFRFFYIVSMFGIIYILSDLKLGLRNLFFRLERFVFFGVAIMTVVYFVSLGRSTMLDRIFLYLAPILFLIIVEQIEVRRKVDDSQRLEFLTLCFSSLFFSVWYFTSEYAKFYR